MLREIRDLGFERAELSHGIRAALVPGVLEAVNAGEIKISSVHNFCPLPLGVEKASPNLYEFSDDKPRDRELALKYTIKTIEFAQRVKAPIVVLHLGSIDLKDYTSKLEEMLERGEGKSPKFEKLRDEAMAAREAKKEKFYAHTKEILHKLLPEAQKAGIKFGFEIRQAVEELPLENDFSTLLREFNVSEVVYWHDIGHAQIKENFGFIHHVEFLRALTPRLGGFHIHDVKFPTHDHARPGSGMVDFAALKQFVKPEHIKVLEISSKFPADSVQRGIAHLKQVWGE